MYSLENQIKKTNKISKTNEMFLLNVKKNKWIEYNLK